MAQTEVCRVILPQIVLIVVLVLRFSSVLGVPVSPNKSRTKEDDDQDERPVLPDLFGMLLPVGRDIDPVEQSHRLPNPWVRAQILPFV